MVRQYRDYYPKTERRGSRYGRPIPDPLEISSMTRTRASHFRGETRRPEYYRYMAEENEATYGIGYSGRDHWMTTIDTAVISGDL